VQPGTVLGYVGNTGNANGTPYHLHYGVYRFLGSAQNPYALLVTRAAESKIKKPALRNAKNLHTIRRHSKRHSSVRKLGSSKVRR